MRGITHVRRNGVWDHFKTDKGKKVAVQTVSQDSFWKRSVVVVDGKESKIAIRKDGLGIVETTNCFGMTKKTKFRGADVGMLLDKIL